MLIQPGPLPPAPRVSVVITAHNQARFIGAAIQSVLAQSLPDWEALVVDDGSSDETWQVIGRYARPGGQVRAVRQGNHGVSHARNAGLAASDPRSPYVQFLDGDDRLRPQGLEWLAAEMEAQPSAVCVWGNSRFIGPDGGPLSPGWSIDTPAEGLYDFDVVSRLLIYPPSACLLRRWAVKSAGGYDYFQTDAEDVDLLYRVALLGRFAFVNQIVTDYRRHSNNATNEQVRQESGGRQMAQKVECYRQAWAHRCRYDR